MDLYAAARTCPVPEYRVKSFCRWIAAAIAGLLLAGPVAPRAEPLPQPRFLLAWGKKGDQPGEFYSPIGIAISRQDEVYVTDLNNARVQRFDTEGKYTGGFDLPRDTPERKSSQAGGIAIDEKGLLYLSFMQQDRIRVYTPAGALVREWGVKGAGDGELYGPGGLAFDRAGDLYVADQRNHRVQKFTREGKFLAKWGEHGSQPGQFDGVEPKGSRFGGPHFVALDRRGRVYTTEGALARIQQFSPEGRPLLAWGDHSEGPGGFGAYALPGGKSSMGPIAVMVDRQDRVWVTSLNNRAQCFTPEGKLLMSIGPGKEPGQLQRPHGMATDSHGNLYVADAANQRIQKFALPP